MICGNCFEDVDYIDAQGFGEDVYCRRCWPKVEKRATKQHEYYKKIGHTGEDMCGCEMCAARADMEI